MRTLRAVPSILLLAAVAVAGEPLAPAPAATGVQWIDGWAAGAEIADKRKRPILVYVGRHTPVCPPCAKLEKGVFAKPASAKLSEDFVAVRILAGDDLTPEGEAFLKRYRVHAFPTLLVLNHEGHVLSRRMKPTTDGLLEALTAGAKAEVELAALRASDEPSMRLAVADTLRKREAYDEAESAYLALLKDQVTVDARNGLARVFASTGRPRKERALLGVMIAEHTTAPRRTAWRIRLATMHEAGWKTRDEWIDRTEAAVGYLVKLAGALKKEENPHGEAEARVALGNRYATLGYPDRATEQFDLALAARPPGPISAAALNGKARLAWEDSDYEVCMALLKRLVKDHPGTQEADAAPGLIHHCEDELGLNPPHEH